MAPATAGPVQLDALGPDGPYRARNRMIVTEVSGAPVAELTLAPSLYVTRVVAALRRADTCPADARAAALTEAGKVFATGTVGGLTVDAYERLVCRVSGMPISVVRSATAETAHFTTRALDSAQQGRPRGATTSWRDPVVRGGSAVWTRKGDVLAVNAAGNHPGVHRPWLEALALGYRVAVRPSRREPFTPHRLVLALREAGFGGDQVVLLPTEHSVADTLLNQVDLAITYGGSDVVARHAADPRVLPQGPGRSKILVTADTDWRDHLDTIVESVCREAGTACVNATSVLVEGDPGPLAAAIAGRLEALPSLPPEHDAAALPVHPLGRAREIGSHLARAAEGTRPWLGAAGVVHDLGDGSAVLRPAVHQVERASAPQLGVELGFPCVWVGPWTPDDGLAPLRGSLALTALTQDADLLDALIAEPTISNVHIGDHPTCWMAPGIPHDGYLSEFLMRSKAVIRG